jgi:hypothetical protein
VEQDKPRDCRHVADHDLVTVGVDVVDQPVAFEPEFAVGLGLEVVLLVEALSLGVREGSGDDRHHLGLLAVEVRVEYGAQ